MKWKHYVINESNNIKIKDASFKTLTSGSTGQVLYLFFNDNKFESSQNYWRLIWFVNFKIYKINRGARKLT